MSVYLDNAATTLKKPPEVSRAVQHAMAALASPGRGGHAPAVQAAQTVFRCRQKACQLFGMTDPENVIFTLNATHALNIAIRSLVSPGDRVAISGYEHNAVTRPLFAMGCDIRIAWAEGHDPGAVLAAFDRTVSPGTKCVICTHVSNVFGYILPIERLARLCADRGVPLIVDASQSAGVLPLDMERLGCAFAAMPGHKGLYGPQGTGMLLCGSGVRTVPLLAGGTGSLSARQEMPDFLPDRLEAGTHNVPGIAGLLAGMTYIGERGMEGILEKERRLLLRARQGLEPLPGVTVYACGEERHQAGVLSFQVAGYDCEAVGEWLAERGIAVRAGLHCAPFAHKSEGTLERGTVRVSFSDFNTEQEVDLLIAQLSHLLD